MSHQPEDRSPEDRPGESQPARTPLDEDTVWAAIVANYGDRPEMGPEVDEDDGAPESDEAHPDPRPGNRTPLFDRSYLDAQLARAEREHAELETPASWDDEGHFVPPVPPPLPLLEPRRKLAWIGLFGSPLLMLVGVVLGWTYPTWISFGLVVAFVGGFGYLVATMPRDRGDWSGDDGAVV
ncbi:MAG: hypothetical protein WBQ50_12930 [Nocardioides sp.]